MRPGARFAAQLCRCLVYLPFRADAGAAPAELRHSTGKLAPAQGSQVAPEDRPARHVLAQKAGSRLHALIALPP
ncbi:MAG: hypothetical protein WAJ91_02615, partial [Rhodoplanes sp.]